MTNRRLIPESFLSEWLERNGVSTAHDVNSGQCEEFAADLAGLLPGSEVVYTEDFFDWDSPEHPGGHAWVQHEGRFYDSECLEGVSEWMSLPFFVRAGRKGGTGRTDLHLSTWQL